MRKSRVRLGPHLVAQTRANPYPLSSRLLKIGGAIFIAALAFFAIKSLYFKTIGPSTPLPTDEKVLGTQDIDSNPNEFYVYEVQKNDTIFSLSEKFQVKWQTLVDINSLKEPYSIVSGSKIRLPANSVTRQQKFYDNLKKKLYIVEAGDSFVGIAQKLNLTVTDLIKANPDLKSPEYIKPGLILRLP